MCGAGALALMVIAGLAGSLFTRTFGPVDGSEHGRTSLFAVGINDLTPARPGFASAWLRLLSALTLALTCVAACFVTHSIVAAEGRSCGTGPHVCCTPTPCT